MEVKDCVESLLKWLKNRRIVFKKIDEKVFRIGEENFLLISPKYDKLLTTDMSVVLNDEDLEMMGQYEIDGLIFQIADKFYYAREGKDFIDNDSSNEYGEITFELYLKNIHELLYIGESSEECSFPHLGVHGSYDLCNGSGSYRDYCNKAKFLKINTLGICEENTLAGALIFQNECKKQGLRSIIGETIVVQHNLHFQYHIKLYCKNNVGWSNLLRINSKINTSSTKSISLQDLEEYTEGLICVLTPTISLKEIVKKLPQFEEIYYQLDFVEWSNNVKEEEWLGFIAEYISKYSNKIEPIALYDSFYIEDYQADIQPILWRIGKRVNFKYRSEDRYFKSSSEYIEQAEKLFVSEEGVDFLFKGIENALKFEEIDFSIPTGQKHLPQYELTEEEKQEFGDSETLFWHLIEKGLEEKVISKGLDVDQYIDRIQEEVRVIELGQVRDYFLIVWDILNFCKKNKILTGIGRGSAAGCLISYLLGIVQIDPLEYGLLFERFLNEGRVGKSMPDIDNDIQGERREEVKRYIEEKYGKAYVAGIGTYGTFKIRASIKDLIRECGGNSAEANYISASIDPEDKFVDLFKHSLKTGANARIYNFVKNHSYQLNHIPTIFQQPKNQSIHAAGIIIVPKDRGEIYEQLPVKSMNDGVIITEWEGGELEDAGFLKVDILGIKQLDKFDEIFKSIKTLRNEDLSLDQIPLDDKKVYRYFQRGWNEDVFQFGGGGLKGYCKVLLPDNIEDLIATVALYRPGPIETGAHEDYAAIKNGKKEPEYYYGLEEITQKTYSKIVYQEQIMQIVQHLGGFTLVEADDIRKAMGKKIPEVMAKYKEKFIQGAIHNGCPPQEAELLWDDMERFAGYAFNRSHAACYAITGYYSQWLKCNFPIEFWLTSLKHSSDNDLQARLAEINNIGDGIAISGPDINYSTTEYRGDIDTNTIYWSLSSIKYVGDNAVLNIMKIREKEKFFDFESFLQAVEEDKEIRRSQLKKGERLLSPINRRTILHLIIAGAFDSIERIQNPSERKYIIAKYYTKLHPELEGLSFDNSKWRDKLGDIYNLMITNQDHRWILEQRRVSGFGVLDFSEMVEKIDFERGGTYYSNSEIIALSLPENNKYPNVVICGGVVEEVKLRNSSKGTFVQLLIHDGSSELITIVWPEVYEQYADEINNSKGKLFFMNGEVIFDGRYQKINVMNSKSFSNISIL